MEPFSVLLRPSPASPHPPLHASLFVLVHAVDQAAGNEGDGHEEDNDGADD